MNKKFIQVTSSKWIFMGERSVATIVYLGKAPDSMGGEETWVLTPDCLQSRHFSSLTECQEYMLRFDDNDRTIIKNQHYFDPVN